MQPPRILVRRPVFWCALAVAVVACVAFAVWPREPLYKGKPLSYWLDSLLPTTLPSQVTLRVVEYGTEPLFAVWSDEDIVRRATAVKAINTLGSSCLTTLLRRLQTRATPARALKEYMLAWAMERHVVHRPFLLISNPPGAWSAEVHRGQAVAALIQLGDIAKPIVPDIIKLAKTDPDPGVRAYGLEVLRHLSPADYAQVKGQTNVVSAAAQ